MEEAKQKWDQEEEEMEEGVEEEALQRRVPPHLNQNARIATNGNCNTNREMMHSNSPTGVQESSVVVQEPEEEELTKSESSPACVEDNKKVVEEQDKQEEPEKCVYFDRNEGGSLTQKKIGSIAECTSSEENFQETRLDSTVEKIEITESLSTKISQQYDDNNLFTASCQPSEINIEEKNASYDSLKIEIEESADVNLEITELDVERLLEKQETHDLYCPNCHSCITRRVILRKRKRSIRTPGEDIKRNKSEIIVDSQLDAIPTHATYEQGKNAAETHQDDGPLALANDHSHDGEPDIFKCLSCFSFFIPTGKGFKLFRLLGDKNEKEEIQNPPQMQAANQNWFSSIFAPNKRKTPTGKGEPAPQYSGIDAVNQFKTSRSSGEMLSNQESDHQAKFAGDTQVNDAENNTTSPPQRNTVSQPTITGSQVDIHTKEPAKVDIDAWMPSFQDAILVQGKQVGIAEISKGLSTESSEGKDTIITVESKPIESATSQRAQTGDFSLESQTSTLARTESVGQRGAEARQFQQMEIIKSIVYGGLVESITSLGVVASAAGGDVATLNILALAAANLISGLFVLIHNLWDLKNEVAERASDQNSEQVDRYQEQLGWRENFRIHAFLAIFSFFIFGLVPPITYGFSFHKSDDKDLKLVAVASASLLCVIILATGKAYVQRPPKSYLKTVVHYISTGLVASGVSYAAGDLIKRLLEKLGLFQSSSVVSLPLSELRPMKSSWASY